MINLLFWNGVTHRARAQSAVADGTRARNRTRRVHGIKATRVTAHKPPFPNSRIMLLISFSLSITKFPPEQRDDQDGMIRLHDRSSTSTSTSTMGSCGRVGKNIRLTRSQRRGTSPSPAQAIRLTLTGRKMLPSGRKPNSRISTGDPLPSSRISAGDPLPSNRISTGDPLPIRVGPSQLARRTPKGLPQDLRT